MKSNKPRVNHEIRCRFDIRLIDETGQLIGTMPVFKARQIAEDRELDLVEISPNSKPPVCKIMDYGKFMYDTKKTMKKQKGPVLKEIKFTPNTDVNDIKTKVNNIKKFLSRGDRVQATVRFRGRQNAHPEIGVELLEFVKGLIEEDMDSVKCSMRPADRSVVMMIERAA